MNAREAMKLLLEGKTLERDDPWYLMKLDENGTLVSCDSKNLHGPYAFSDCHTMIGEFDRVYEEKEHKPCPYCGSTPIIMQYRGMTCSSCVASTWDSCTRNAAKWAWDRGDVFRVTILEDPDNDEVDG